MKTINFYNYALDAISNSIAALAGWSVKDIVQYYGDENECTIKSYFSAQTDGENIYDHTEEFSEDTLIGSIEDLEDDFENARYDAFNKWLENELEQVDEEEMQDVSGKVTITPVTETYMDEDFEGNVHFEEFISYYDVKFREKDPDMVDEEMNTSGTILFERLFSAAQEIGDISVHKIARLAGAKYYYVDRENDSYSCYFWL